MEVLRTAIFQLMQRRKKEGFMPAEVVQQLYPEDWEVFLPDLYDTLITMHQAGLVDLMIDGKSVKPSSSNFEMLKILKPSKLI
jgi:Fe2+ or Zn2+ uptake regulation protein